MERRTKALDLCIKNALKQCDPVVGGESRCDKSGRVAKWRVQERIVLELGIFLLSFCLPQNRFFDRTQNSKIYLIYLAGIMAEL